MNAFTLDFLTPPDTCMAQFSSLSQIKPPKKNTQAIVNLRKGLPPKEHTVVPRPKKEAKKTRIFCQLIWQISSSALGWQLRRDESLLLSQPVWVRVSLVAKGLRRGLVRVFIDRARSLGVASGVRAADAKSLLGLPALRHQPLFCFAKQSRFHPRAGRSKSMFVKVNQGGGAWMRLMPFQVRRRLS